MVSAPVVEVEVAVVGVVVVTSSSTPVSRVTVSVVSVTSPDVLVAVVVVGVVIVTSVSSTTPVASATA